MKISVLLPYKENFSEKYAGAVSLFVKDTVKNSKYFHTTYVFGNTSYKKTFLKNYINVDLKKHFFQSNPYLGCEYTNENIKNEINNNISLKDNSKFNIVNLDFDELT